ncbi:MAG: hypothetical protein K8R69_06185 [Deltaproteobacteria bacterium]|nr:hypothetical protein [Deltaproteobacteria bacterium]
MDLSSLSSGTPGGSGAAPSLDSPKRPEADVSDLPGQEASLPISTYDTEYSNPMGRSGAGISTISLPVSVVPGHPEGEISPSFDVGHKVRFRLVLKREMICQEANGKKMMKLSGHVEKDGIPFPGAPFMRFVQFSDRKYLDTPLSNKEGIDGSFSYSYLGDDGFYFGFFLPPVESPVDHEEWNKTNSWLEMDTPTEGFLTITSPSSEFTLVGPARGPLPVCPSPRSAEQLSKVSFPIAPEESDDTVMELPDSPNS